MTDHLARGILLYQQDRHAQAERELGLAVAADPGDPTAAAYLALCLAEQGKLDPAEEAAALAVRAGPGDPFPHLARCQVLYKRGKLAEAEASARASLRLDPTNPSAYGLLVAVRFDRRDWPGALAAADEGLSHDPLHPACANARTVALLQLGRKAEATDAATAALATAPDSSAAHTARGWALLHESNPAEALVHFREALRLDPTNEWAREGMIAGLKARYWVYRQMLRFFLWMGRLGRTQQWGLIVGLLVVQQLLGRVAMADPALAPFAAPALYALIGFILLTWVADPLFNLLLRLNKYGRHALTPDQRKQSHWVAGLVVAGIAAAGAWAFAPDLDVRAGPDVPRVIGQVTAIACVFLILPISAVFRLPAGWPRRIMAGYAAVMGLIWAGSVASFAAAVLADTPDGFVAAADRGWSLATANVWAGVLSGFLANALATAPRRA